MVKRTVHRPCDSHPHVTCQEHLIQSVRRTFVGAVCMCACMHACMYVCVVFCLMLCPQTLIISNHHNHHHTNTQTVVVAVVRHRHHGRAAHPPVRTKMMSMPVSTALDCGQRGASRLKQRGCVSLTTSSASLSRSPPRRSARRGRSPSDPRRWCRCPRARCGTGCPHPRP